MNELLKPVFKGGTPSVKKFRMFLEPLSPEIQQYYWEQAYQIGILQWMEMGERERLFFVCLIHHNWQRYLTFLLEKTIFQRLRYSLRDGKEVWKLIEFSEGRQEKRKGSRNNLSFCFLLCFESEIQPKINTCRVIYIQEPITAEELWDLLGPILITDSDHGHRTH